MITTPLILNLLLILSVAWLLGYFFSRFGLPVVLGEYIFPRFAGRITDKGGKAFTFALLAALLMVFVTTLIAPITLK
jgi:Kef-type K+ transport system membrane component KefB